MSEPTNLDPPKWFRKIGRATGYGVLLAVIFLLSGTVIGLLIRLLSLVWGM